MYYAPGNNNIPQGTEVGSFLDGFFFSQSVGSTNSGVTPGMVLAQGVPAFTTPLPDLDPTIANGNVPDYYNQASDHSPTLQSWTFDVQRALSTNTLLDVAYVGQHGYRLVGQLENLDQVPTKYLALGSVLNESVTSPDAVAAGIAVPYPGFTGSVAQALRPFPQYLGINDNGEPTGTSSYQGLQTKVQRRLSNGLNFLVSYTLSKTLTNTGQQGTPPGPRARWILITGPSRRRLADWIRPTSFPSATFTNCLLDRGRSLRRREALWASW